MPCASRVDFMDWMEFVASLVGSLAWPVAVVALLIVFRPVLSELASGGVKRWKAGPSGVEVEYWDRETTEVKAAIREQLAEGERPAALTDGSLSEELAAVIAASPSAAVVEAFSRIEIELRRIVVNAAVASDDEVARMSARRLSLLALDHDLITAESANGIEGLAVMRNLAAHGAANTELDESRALEFVHLTDAILFALRSRA